MLTQHFCGSEEGDFRFQISDFRVRSSDGRDQPTAWMIFLLTAEC